MPVIDPHEAFVGLPTTVKLMASPEIGAFVLASVTVTVNDDVLRVLVDTVVGFAVRLTWYGRWLCVITTVPIEWPFASVAVIVQVPATMDAV